MIRATAVAAIALLLTGCGTDSEPKADPTPTATGKVDVVSGKPLADFEGLPSYDWRVRLADTHTQVGEELHKVSDTLTEDQLDDVLATCDSIQREPRDLVGDTVKRFPGLDRAQAEQVIAIAKKHVCP